MATTRAHSSALRREADKSAHPALDPLVAAAQQSGNSDIARQLADVRDWLGPDLARFEAELGRLERILDERSSLLVAQTGRWVRPMLVLAGARLGGRALDETVRDVALASELARVSTNLHCAVIDDGREPPGTTAVRVVFGNSTSILAGDHLLVGALQAVQRHGESGLLLSLLDILQETVAANAVRLDRRGLIDPDEEANLRLIRGRIAALFGWSLEAGGVVAGLDDDRAALLRQVGVSVGVAFQLSEDVIAYRIADGAGGPDRAQPIADLQDGRPGWPLLLAMKGSPALCAELEELLHSDVIPDDRLEDVRRRVRETPGALAATRERAINEGRAAIASLRELPASPARDGLEVLIEQIANRGS